MNNCCATKNTQLSKPKLIDLIKPYQPLIIMVLFVFIASLSISLTFNISWMPLFMGLFLLNFSMFKLFDIFGFIRSFKMYDIIGKRFSFYDKIYPFIELMLSLAYLTSFALPIVNVLTLIIMGVGLIGVLQVKFSGNIVKCACMGSLINVPVGTITILENSFMILMAIYMLIHSTT